MNRESVLIGHANGGIGTCQTDVEVMLLLSSEGFSG